MGWSWRLLGLIAVFGTAAVYCYCQIRPPGHGFWAASWPSLCGLCDVLAPSAEPSPPLEMEILPRWPVAWLLPILRSITVDIGPIPAKTAGLVLAAGAFVAPLALAAFRWSRFSIWTWLLLFSVPWILLALIWTSWQGPFPPWLSIGQALTATYFAVFLVFIPLERARARRLTSADGAGQRP